MRQLVDTNVILRFLVGDVPIQKTRAESWFKEAEAGKRVIVVTPLVIAEVCFVLETFYRQPRAQVADALEIFVSQRWLEIPEREALLGLWQWYREGLHFVDSFLLATAAVGVATTVLTFDRELQVKVR